MNWQAHLPALLLAVPLLGAFATPLFSLGGKTLRNAWFIVVSTFVFLIALALWHEVSVSGILVYVMGGENFALTLPSGMKYPVRIILEIDALSAFMVLAGSITSMAGAWFTLSYMDRFTGISRFISLYFLLTVGMLGMMVTGDLFNFFVFIEIASVASYGLVAFWRDKPQAVEASFKYMLLSQVAAMLVLLAVGFLYGKYNVLNMGALGSVMQMGLVEKFALAMLFSALALKCGSFPMYLWIPDAHAEAPASVSCLLVTVSQASLYGLFRVAFSIYGVSLTNSVVAWAIIILGLISMLVAVSMAVVQHEVKRLMAYHAISQTGYMMLGVGIGLLVLADPQALAEYGFTAIKGGVFHIFNHAMYKGLLFLTAGTLFYMTGTRDLNKMGGLIRKSPITATMFLIAAAAIAGLPPMNGYASKLLIYQSSFAIHPFITVVALVTSVLTLASFVKVFQTAFLGPEHKALVNAKKVPATMIIGMGMLTVAILLLTFFPTWALSNLVEPAAKALVDQAGYIAAIMGGAF